MKSRTLFHLLSGLVLATFLPVYSVDDESPSDSLPPATRLDLSYIQNNQSSLGQRLDKVLAQIKNRYRFVSEDGQPRSDGKPVWTERHNEVLKSIYQNCGPSGNGQTVMDCEGISFGVDLVKDKLDQGQLPGFKSNSEIKYQEPYHDQMHMDLMVSGVGTSKILGELIEYNLYILDEEPEKARQVFLKDPALRLHIEDAEKQPDRYMGIIGRVASADQIMSPPYNGNLGGFLEDQYFMGDGQQKALVAGLNYIQTLTADSPTKGSESVYSNRLLGSDGRILDSEVGEALRKGGEIYIPADATLEAISDQFENFPKGLIDLDSEDPFQGLRDYIETQKLKAQDPTVKGLVEEETWRQLLELKTKDSWGFEKYGARLINENGIRSICRESGLKGFRPPKGPESCQNAYLEGFLEFEPGFREDPQYVDSATGKFSENLLLAQVNKRRESLVQEISKEDLAVKELIQVLAGDAAIREYVRLDIRNNPEQFAKSELLLGSQGAVSASIGGLEVAISKAESDLGPGVSGSDLPFGLFADSSPPSDSNQAPGMNSKFTNQNRSSTGTERRQEKRVAALLGNANQEPLEVDDASPSFPPFSGGSGFSGFGPWSKPKANSGAFRQQNPADRANLLKFPEALQEPLPVDSNGSPMLKQAVGIFCRPENYVLKDDPYCTCLHGPRIRIFYDQNELEDCQ
jgi:hypothetical protein